MDKKKNSRAATMIAVGLFVIALVLVGAQETRKIAAAQLSIGSPSSSINTPQNPDEKTASMNSAD